MGKINGTKTEQLKYGNGMHFGDVGGCHESLLL